MRIIGGRWRGRKFSVPKTLGLRPTPNRVRETLFNWLMHDIQGAHCLDVFAGSGALGLEALSRGAASVTFIDQSRPAIRAINTMLTSLNIDQGHCVCATIPQFNKPLQPPQFNIIFLDPPFRQQLLKPAIDWLLKQHLLAPNALIYIEAEKELSQPPVPNSWQCLKQIHVGQSCYFLFLSIQQCPP